MNKMNKCILAKVEYYKDEADHEVSAIIIPLTSTYVSWLKEIHDGVRFLPKNCRATVQDTDVKSLGSYYQGDTWERILKRMWPNLDRIIHIKDMDSVPHLPGLREVNVTQGGAVFWDFYPDNSDACSTAAVYIWELEREVNTGVRGAA